MKRTILFIHGAGEGAYNADRLLVDSLQKELGAEYEVRYPEMPDEANEPDKQWKEQIGKEIARMLGQIVLVGHSVGASLLAKSLIELNVKRPVSGIFLLETPFWGGNGWRYEGYEKLELPKDAATKLPDAPIFLYHTYDDATVPFEHLALYAKLLPRATVREIDKGGHQLNNDLSMVAKDIKSL
jgi:predicted alpha/beta hydrolase family esterase